MPHATWCSCDHLAPADHHRSAHHYAWWALLQPVFLITKYAYMLHAVQFVGGNVTDAPRYLVQL